MFRTTHIRSKLAVALAIPLAALVAVSGFEVVSASRAVDEVRSETELATSSLGPGSLVTRLQDERNRASIDLIGLGAAADLPAATNEEARGWVDEARQQLEAQLASRSAEVQATFAPAFEALDGLEQLRADVDGYTGPMDLTNDEFADEVFTRYTDIVETFFDATSTIALSVDDSDLRNGVEIIDGTGRQSEMRARIVRTAVLATVTGTVEERATLAEVAALYDRGQGFDDDIRTNAVGPFAGIADSLFAEPEIQAFNSQVEGFIAGEALDIGSMLDVVSSSDDSVGYLGLRNRAGTELDAHADELVADAVARQRTFMAIAGGALLLALFVTWLASRSITRPLRSLKTQAEEMAGTTLPAAVRQILETPTGEDVVIPEIAPVAVKSRDEVAEVATALNAVQTSALDLAVEQAVLRRNISDSYVNLGRRNQNLLSRQLDFITDLERNESDPDTLEGLFRLDHLATRMRRNAESLLVLAGIEPPRQWSAPVKVSDVVRAALGEVEDYQRVVVRHLEPASVTGSVASDVAHVLAELLENALSFSPPEQSVEVKGRLTTQGYTVAITDNGLGMSADELERANRRLAGAESFTVAPSRYLGHYVAGHLASRMGVSVELQDSPAGGVTARIELPMDVLANDETDPFLVSRAARAEAEEVAAAASPAEIDVRPSEPTAAPVAPAEPSFTESGLPRRGGATAPAPMDPEPVAEAPVPEAPIADTAPPAPAAPAEPTFADTFGISFDDVPTVETTSYEADESTTPAAEAAEPPAAPTPQRTEPARGFGGLAVAQPGGSMFTVAAQQARRVDPADGADTAGATTPTGLVRRVPGAQRPDAPLPTASRPADAPAEEQRSTPDDVYAFLSNFQSGVSRGRADAHATNPTTEDER